MTAIAACRTCGTAPLEYARFCHGCGALVQDGDTRAEYKQVTVLFADVVHSMDIAAAVGPERLRVGLALPLAGRVPGRLAVADDEDAARVRGGSRHGRRRYGEG